MFIALQKKEKKKKRKKEKKSYVKDLRCRVECVACYKIDIM